tara:strand:+ start:324 stop:545 length:222 start_codon:yes stop_codon:yes gene_type:complete
MFGCEVQALWSKEVQGKVWEGCLRQCLLDELERQEEKGSEYNKEIFSENHSRKAAEKVSEEKRRKKAEKLSAQ